MRTSADSSENGSKTRRRLSSVAPFLVNFMFLTWPVRKYLVVFDGVVAQALPLPEPLWDLLSIAVRIDAPEVRQILVYLGEGLRTVHVGLPNRTARLRTVTAFMINRTCKGRTLLDASLVPQRTTTMMFVRWRWSECYVLTLFYLWAYTATSQHAPLCEKCGFAGLYRWHTSGSELGKTRPDGPEPEPRSWWTAPPQTWSSPQSFSPPAKMLGCEEKGTHTIFTSSRIMNIPLWAETWLAGRPLHPAVIGSSSPKQWCDWITMRKYKWQFSEAQRDAFPDENIILTYF